MSDGADSGLESLVRSIVSKNREARAESQMFFARLSRIASGFSNERIEDVYEEAFTRFLSGLHPEQAEADESDGSVSSKVLGPDGEAAAEKPGG